MSTVLRYICKAGDGDFSRSENFQNYTCLACLFQVWLRWKIALSCKILLWIIMWF